MQDNLVIRSSEAFDVERENDQLTISGYVSLKGITDTYGYKFPKKNKLYDLSYYKKQGKLFLNHNSWSVKEIVGTVVSIKEDEKGLFARYKLATPVDEKSAYGQIIQNIKDGLISSFSTGSRDTMERDSDGNNTKTIESMKIYEVSLVGTPAVSGAGVTGRQGNIGGENMSQEEINALIDRLEKKDKERESSLSNIVERLETAENSNKVLMRTINDLEDRLTKERESKDHIKSSLDELEIKYKDSLEKEKTRVADYLKDFGKVATEKNLGTSLKYGTDENKVKYRFNDSYGRDIEYVKDDHVQEAFENLRHQMRAADVGDMKSFVAIQDELFATFHKNFERDNAFWKKYNPSHYDNLKRDFESFIRNERINLTNRDNTAAQLSGGTPNFQLIFPEEVDKTMILIAHTQSKFLQYLTYEPMIYERRLFQVPQMTNLGLAGIRASENAVYKGFGEYAADPAVPPFSSAGDYDVEKTEASVEDFGIGTNISFRLKQLSRSYANDTLQKIMIALSSSLLTAIERHLFTKDMPYTLAGGSTSSTVNSTAFDAQSGLLVNTNVLNLEYTATPSADVSTPDAAYGVDVSGSVTGTQSPYTSTSKVARGTIGSGLSGFHEGHIAHLDSVMDYRINPAMKLLALPPTPLRYFTIKRGRDLINSKAAMIGMPQKTGMDYRDLYYLDTCIKRVPTDFIPEDLKFETATTTGPTAGRHPAYVRFRRNINSGTEDGTDNRTVAIFGDFSKIHAGMSPTRIVPSEHYGYPSQQYAYLAQKYFGFCLPYKLNTARKLQQDLRNTAAAADVSDDTFTGAVMARMLIRTPA